MNLDRLLYYENIRTDKIVRSAVELAEKARAAGMSLFIMRCRGGFWER